MRHGNVRAPWSASAGTAGIPSLTWDQVLASGSAVVSIGRGLPQLWWNYALGRCRSGEATQRDQNR